jgi:hypothetical protein
VPGRWIDEPGEGKERRDSQRRSNQHNGEHTNPVWEYKFILHPHHLYPHFKNFTECWHPLFPADLKWRLPNVEVWREPRKLVGSGLTDNPLQ